MPSPTKCGKGAPSLALGPVGEDAPLSFAPGEELDAVFGSQSGREIAFVLHGSGIVLEQVSMVRAQLIYDGNPLSDESFSGALLTCAPDSSIGKGGEGAVWDGGEGVVWEGALLINVSDHPTVSSVVFLDHEPAELRVQLLDESGAILAETSYSIVLVLG